MTLPLRLVTSNPKLIGLCNRMQARLVEVTELSGLTLPVELLPTFDDLPEAQKSQAIRESCAAYRVSTDTIYVNDSLFESQEPEVMEAIMAHELGHACAHHRSLMKSLPIYQELGSQGEEFLADRLTCAWGFFDPLAKMREVRYKTAYVDALRKWPDEGAYCTAMQNYRFKKLMGSV